MSKLKALIWTVLFGVSVAVSGQYTKEFKRIFFDAEYLYQTGFYEEAFNRYKNLLTLDPGNSNILFHCGACCLSIPGNEDQAVSYLQEAAPGVSLSYKDQSHKEAGAPVLTYYMLGKAYHLNNSFEDAIENYTQYLETDAKEDPLQLAYAELQIEACKRAAEVVNDAPSFEFQSVLDHFDDELPSCNNPVISGDGNILIFLVDYPNDKKIMMSTLSGDLWSRPRVINSEIGMVGETYPVSLSYDGLSLYLVHHFYSHSDVFVSHFEGNRWSEAEALGPNVNGRTSEEHASISRDGNTLYFTSDARGGEGSLDIYVSRLNEKGEWGGAENLGPVINTAFEEHSPFISANDSILFFSSQGHASIGGLDVFYSELGEDGAWTEPVNLGYPVNTTADNIFFNPGWDELDAVYAVRRADDPTSNSINMVIELDPPEELAEAEPAEAVPEEEVEEEQIEMEPQDAEPEGEVALLVIPVEQAIEPEETDEIHEVLNRGALEPEPVSAPEPTVISPEKPAPGFTSLQTMLPFDHNTDRLSMAGMLEVEKVAEVMHRYPESDIHLSGHADATGSADYNLLLSGQRAARVGAYLEMRGIDAKRIRIEGKGDMAPVARNAYPDGSDAPLGRYLNRQVIVTVNNSEPMQSEISGYYVPEPLKITGSSDDSGSSVYWFTLQLAASLKPMNKSYFSGVGSFEVYECRDGYYRYASGKFHTFEDARAYLKKMRESGYQGAFIQTLMWYAGAVK